MQIPPSGIATISSKDPKGFYSALGVDPSASADEIKAAFRDAAKKYHPDKNPDPKSGEMFGAIRNAYENLSDPEQRAQYDSLGERPAPSKAAEPPNPVVCSKCGKVTAQPRYAVYRYVVSLLITTLRNPIQGIFCADCARRTALKASAISAVAGWWGLPWGPIYTVMDIVRNAFGGYEPPLSRDYLAWRNCLAFLHRGEHKLAYALASKLRRSADEEIAIGALHVIDVLKANGIGEVGALQDKWKPSIAQILVHVALLVTIPTAIFAAVELAPSTPNVNRYAGEDLATTSTPPVATNSGQPATDAAPAVSAPQTPAPIQTCAVPISNGQVIEDNANWTAEENAIEIQNGSGGDAIIKIRDAQTGRMLLSFFVSNNSTARYALVPDGTYRIQYAFGDKLDSSCLKFASLSGLGEFPDAETFQTESDGYQVTHQVLNYTLYPVPGGNVRPHTIDIASFDAP